MIWAFVAHCSMPRRTTSTSGSSGMGTVFDVTETVPGGESFSVLFRFRFGGGIRDAANDQGGFEGSVVVRAGACNLVLDGSHIVFVNGNLDQGFPVFAGTHDVFILEQGDDMFFHNDPGVIVSTMQIGCPNEGFERICQNGVFIATVGADLAFT